MINETFINTCFNLVLSNTDKKEDKSVYRDIVEVLEFYKSKENFDIPVSVKNKFDCLNKICELKLKGHTIDNIIESVTTGKFKDLYDFLITKYNDEIDQNTIETYVEQIKTKRKLKYVFNSYDKLNSFIELLKSGSFESVEDLVKDYETYIKKAFIDLSTIERSVSLESASSLDLLNDDYNSVLDTIKNKYESIQKVPSGYHSFDKEALNGGFEPSRVYVFGGGTGSGKSTLLNNILVNNVLKRDNKYNDLMEGENEDPNKKQVFVYVTLENTLDEAFLRTYQPMFGVSTNDILNEINGNQNIGNKLKDEMRKNNINIVMRYFSPNTITFLDIRTLLDEIKDSEPEAEITGLCVDYLELINPERNYELYRLQLGDIVLSAKSVAVDYGIPVIMPTQLNRSVYRNQNTSDLNMDQLGESIKKAENADFISLQVRDPVQDDVVQFKVVKNRAGKANVSFNFKVNWDTYKFNRCYTVSNSDKAKETNADVDTEKFEIPKTTTINSF